MLIKEFLYCKINLIKKEIQIECQGRTFNGSLLSSSEGCGVLLPIKNLVWHQKYYYDNSTYSESYDFDGGYFICPHCGVITICSENDVNKFKYSFKDKINEGTWN